ncbi:hypothetical protein ACWGB8_06805 [Kitasatospora sp. NPDC054939]
MTGRTEAVPLGKGDPASGVEVGVGVGVGFGVGGGGVGIGGVGAGVAGVGGAGFGAGAGGEGPDGGLSPLLRTVLWAFPADYRRERGDELAAVLMDATAGASRRDLAAEVIDTVRYGLRVRFGLISRSPVGRLLARSAPLAAGGVAGLAAYPWLSEPRSNLKMFAEAPAAYIGVLFYVIVFCQIVLPLLLAASVMLGRWVVARPIAALIAFGGILPAAQALWRDLGTFNVCVAAVDGLPFLLSGLLVLAAPREMLAEPSWRMRSAVLAAGVGGVLLAAIQGGYGSVPSDVRPAAGMLLLPLFVLLAATPGWSRPAAVALAVLPLTAPYAVLGFWGGRLSGETLTTLTLAACLVLLLTVTGRIGGKLPPELTGGGALR